MCRAPCSMHFTYCLTCPRSSRGDKARSLTPALAAHHRAALSEPPRPEPPPSLARVPTAPQPLPSLLPEWPLPPPDLSGQFGPFPKPLPGQPLPRAIPDLPSAHGQVCPSARTAAAGPSMPYVVLGALRTRCPENTHTVLRFFPTADEAVTPLGHIGLCDVHTTVIPLCSPFSSAPPTPAGVAGEVGLLAENGEPGEDMEEALVCPETGTDPVLQVPGETLPPRAVT